MYRRKVFFSVIVGKSARTHKLVMGIFVFAFGDFECEKAEYFSLFHDVLNMRSLEFTEFYALALTIV